ncbi:MAG: WecB/TagA/CpsF family glycosyltransferase [Candidatus Sericytochromatia bacterium]|nr:WecB/TagA/CpsF family glycosyltransferase [Candidatus Sericytochromatia bacterium]
MPERATVLGLPVDVLDMPEAVNRVAACLGDRASGRPGPLHVVTMNAEMAMQAQRDPGLGDIIREAGLVVADGSGVVWAVRRQHPGRPVRKVAGVELVRELAAHGASLGWRFYLLGGQPGVAAAAGHALVSAYPGLCVAGCRDGFFGVEQEADVLAEVRAARPDVLLVALGVPRQEKWIRHHQSALGVPVAMGVGGSFDVLAGRVRRAPVAFRRLHLEWLFRLLQEPWRLQRMRATLPAFVREVLSRPSGPSSEVQS